MIIRSEDFGTSEHAAFLDGISTLRAIFLTHATVGMLPPGEHRCSAPGRSIFIYSDGALPDVGTLARGLSAYVLSDVDTVREAASEIQYAAEATQRRLAGEMLERESAPQGSIVFVLYAGLNAFNQSLRFAETLRARFSSAIIIVVTCDCSITEKTRVLKISHARGTTNLAIVTSQCGGMVAMHEVFRRIRDGCA